MQYSGSLGHCLRHALDKGSLETRDHPASFIVKCLHPLQDATTLEETKMRLADEQEFHGSRAAAERKAKEDGMFEDLDHERLVRLALHDKGLHYMIFG